MAKPNKKGRSDYQSFVRIDRYLINSEAYRSLSVYAPAPCLSRSSTATTAVTMARSLMSCPSRQLPELGVSSIRPTAQKALQRP